MSIKSPQRIEFQKVALPATWNWVLDSQPERHENPEDYIQLAKDLTTPSLSFAVDALVDAGYVHPGKRDDVLAKLQSLKPKKSLELNGVSVCWRVKSETSIGDKILKDSKANEDIGDYFGLKFVARSVEDVVRLRDAILSSDNLSSRKCEFTYPSERGYRSHKSHHLIEDNGRRLSIESIITHADFEKMDKLTHDLMNTERRVLKLQFEATDFRMSRKFSSCAAGLKDIRTRINHDTAAAAGLNELCAPDAITGFKTKHVDNWARKIVEGMTPENFKLNMA